MQILKLKKKDMGLFIEGRKELLFVEGQHSQLNNGRTLLITPDLDQGELAFIGKVEYLRLSNVTDGDAKLSGFQDRLELMNDFWELYPAVGLMDIVTCVHLEKE